MFPSEPGRISHLLAAHGVEVREDTELRGRDGTTELRDNRLIEIRLDGGEPHISLSGRGRKVEGTGDFNMRGFKFRCMTSRDKNTPKERRGNVGVTERIIWAKRFKF